MFSPIGGSSFQATAGLSINIQRGGGIGGQIPPVGDGGCPCAGIGDGFHPSSELAQGGSPGFGLSPFGPAGLKSFASQLTSSPMPDCTQFLNTEHPWSNGIGGPDNSLPAELLGVGGGDMPALLDGGGLPPIGDGSLTSQALMIQAASSDANQAALIGSQTGSLGSLMGAQGTALAGVNPLMSGLMSNYG